jgi:hypothetical protein
MIYWSSRNSIGDAEQDGRDPQILVKGPTVDSPAGVALDGPEIYWANHGNNSIAEANRGGDADARILVRGPELNKPRGVAVYGDPIYWVNQGS